MSKPYTSTYHMKKVYGLSKIEFADCMYHQVQGTAMGTKMAPSYANLFMAEELLKKSPTDPILWKRYIDDILCIWPGSKQSLDTFIEYLNGAHPTIKFTCESSPYSVDFLDITIYKGADTDPQVYLILNLFSNQQINSNIWNTPQPTLEIFSEAS